MAHDPAPSCRPDLGGLLRGLGSRLDSLYTESQAGHWQLTRLQFSKALERSIAKRFSEENATSEKLEAYLNSLHLDDLVLAAACMEGSERAWECFVSSYRSYLRAAAGAITKGSRSGADAHELADSLFAELFGLMDGKRGEASLFRYFHGRSSLKTWLRTVLAQRHVDVIRKSRRWSCLEGEDGEEIHPVGTQMVTPPSVDPHRAQYLQRFLLALTHCLSQLEQSDRKRLELYYAREKTLAEIGRALGEHESSASRNLERIRRELRAAAEDCLRSGRPSDGLPPMKDAEIALCFQYAAEDALIDFRQIFPERVSGKTERGRKESS